MVGCNTALLLLTELLRFAWLHARYVEELSCWDNLDRQMGFHSPFQPHGTCCTIPILVPALPFPGSAVTHYGCLPEPAHLHPNEIADRCFIPHHALKTENQKDASGKNKILLFFPVAGISWIRALSIRFFNRSAFCCGKRAWEPLPSIATQGLRRFVPIHDQNQPMVTPTLSCRYACVLEYSPLVVNNIRKGGGREAPRKDGPPATRSERK